MWLIAAIPCAAFFEKRTFVTSLYGVRARYFGNSNVTTPRKPRPSGPLSGLAAQ